MHLSKYKSSDTNVFLKLFLYCIAACSLILIFKVHAGISVSPLSATLTLEDDKSHLITVFNTDPNRPVAIRVKALAWQLNREGRDIRKPTKDLVIFPMQFILPAGGRRSIRIAPRNHIAPKIEQSYRVIVQEVPVDLQGENKVHTGVKLVTSYATAFYIAPTKPLSNLAIKDTSVSRSQLKFSLVNNGNAHTHLHKLSIAIYQNGKEYMIDSIPDLKGIYNENMLANGHRSFSLNWPEAIQKSIELKTPMNLQLKVNCESCGGLPVTIDAHIP